MSNELQVFHEQEVLGKGFKVYGGSDNPLFLAKDVAEWIDYSKSNGKYKVSQMTATVDDEEKLVSTIKTPDMTQAREMTFLTEEGLYEVLMQSRKPIAKQFKKKVKEILKSIRKNGAYMTDDTLEKAISDPDFMIGLLVNLKEEKQKRIEAEKLNEKNKPLVTFAERCLASKDSILVRELAKLATDEGYIIGEKNLYKKLREWGLVLKYSTEPSQRAMDSKLFEVIKRVKETPYGNKTMQTTKVTPKGQVYIIERLLKENSGEAI